MDREIINKLDLILEKLDSENFCAGAEKPIVKNIDMLGRITIPKSIRVKYGIEDGGSAKLYESGNKIIIEIIK